MWKCEVLDQWALGHGQEVFDHPFQDQVALGQEVFDHPFQIQEDPLAEALHAFHLQSRAQVHGEVPDQLERVIPTQEKLGDPLVEDLVK